MKIENDNPLNEVLEFWFVELSPEDWYSGVKEVDEEIARRFAGLHKHVAANEFWRYRDDSKSLLAEVIVLDQFSRQLFRDSGEAFAYDRQALSLAQQIIIGGLEQSFSKDEKQFLYMPFMHSESKAIHVEALVLFESLGDAESLKFEKIHKDIIDRFGRYPHRNESLGRTSTTEEVEYLKENQESFF
ncbi:MAG: DUF924 family protein [Candidatus Paceibacteria bacterium]